MIKPPGFDRFCAIEPTVPEPVKNQWKELHGHGDKLLAQDYKTGDVINLAEGNVVVSEL